MSEGKVLYDGSVEVILSFGNNDVDGILDFTMEDNYTDVVISLTLKNPSDGTQIILLFGDTFESQIAYSKQIAEEYTLSLASYKNETASIVSTTDDKMNASASSGSKFHHVTNVSDKKLDGAETDKQMIVMSIAKYDPRCKQEESGSELIRVFTRSYNATKYVDNAIQAIPYRVNASFACAPCKNEENKNIPFLAIERTNPQNGSS